MALDNEQRLQRLGEAAAVMVEDDMLVGLGTGSTAAAMIDALGKRYREGLQITAVSTSEQTSKQATLLGIPLVDLNDIDRLDICIDGADEIDPALNVVKGRGGALLFEKLVARRAKRYVIIATTEKLVDRLGTRLPLPVEVIPEGWPHTAEEIARMGFRPEIRKREGSPFMTDGGHFILDCEWPSRRDGDHGAHALALKSLTGVVDHGLFIDMVDTTLTVDVDGSVRTQSGSRRR